jgi:hypothetical protein
MPREYNDFVQHWKLTHYNATMNKDIFTQFRTLLLHYADENKVHWLTAPKAPYAPKPGKAKPSKHNDKNTTGTREICTHCNANGHNITTCRYVGKPDTPKCTWPACGKVVHT